MTMKELRISMGMSQRECAEYLGMSVRNYQNYENNQVRENTVKYNAAYRRLEAYKKALSSPPSDREKSCEYHTNVVAGEALQTLIRHVRKFQKRDCFSLLSRYIEKNTEGKIAILYGLRRTGKTTLLFQMIGELPADETAYIKIRTSDNMSLLTRDLEQLRQQGKRCIFIDEITLMEDFIGTAAVLSDIFASMGMKIVVSGTDSLGFAMADRDELYDRNVMIHTSFIPFREYSRLLGIRSVDTYIEYGGTLKMENMGFSDPDSAFDDVSFRDDESTRKYIDTSISRNIQHTLKNDRFGENFSQLRELYDNGELTNVINRLVESMNHEFLLCVVQERFRSHEFGSAKELLLHDAPAETAHVLYDVDEENVVRRLKEIIDVRERHETVTEVTDTHIKKIEKYLLMLDLLTACREYYETGSPAKYIIFTQPGMRCAITKALVYSLMQDGYFSGLPEDEKSYIAGKILEDVKGRMLEDIVLLESQKAASGDEEVFKFRFDDGGEYDMVIRNRVTSSVRLYEVKHSDKAVSRQTRYLRDEEKTALIEKRFGKIEGRYVIYRGRNQVADGIEYLNAEEFLNGLQMNE